MEQTNNDAVVIEGKRDRMSKAEDGENLDKIESYEKLVQDSDSGRGQTSSGSSAGSDTGDDQQEENDCFVDASDVAVADSDCDQVETAQASRTTATTGDDVDLSKSLNETARIMRMALNNEFVRATDLCEPRASHELYAGLAHATLSFLRAALTLEQGDLQAALASVQNSVEVSTRMRRQVSTASMLARFLTPYSRTTPDYSSYSDLEIHAELVNAESMLLHTLISFLADQSVICLVKGAFRIRACHQRYKECIQILEVRKNWSSSEARQHFESGVRMGNGIFNLLMSYLPRRVLRFLEYVGFSGSRSKGISELESSIELGDGLRSVLSALCILVYHSYVENLFGLGLYDAQKVRYLNERFLSEYQDSAFFLLFKGRYQQMMGNLDEALECFQKCIDAQDDWKQFHCICHWEMMWCYNVQMEWLKAAHYANLLRAHSKWSPASYTYQYASFLYAQLIQDERQGKLVASDEEYERRLQEVSSLMESVPSLRIRYAGKTIPADKFAIERSMKFNRQGRRLAIPALEFLYIWNIFCILKNNKQQVQKILNFIEHERDVLMSSTPEPSMRDDETKVEDLCLMYLLQGMCQKHLGREQEAEQSFRQVIDNQDKLMHGQEKFLVPHAAMELTLLKLDARQYNETRVLIKSTRSDYTGYLLETIVHFRLHAASRLVRQSVEPTNKLDDQTETSSTTRSRSSSFELSTTSNVGL